MPGAILGKLVDAWIEAKACASLAERRPEGCAAPELTAAPEAAAPEAEIGFVQALEGETGSARAVSRSTPETAPGPDSHGI